MSGQAWLARLAAVLLRLLMVLESSACEAKPEACGKPRQGWLDWSSLPELSWLWAGQAWRAALAALARLAKGVLMFCHLELNLARMLNPGG